MHSTDRGIFLSLTAVLAGFGLLMVYSASITSWPSDFEQVYLSRHAIFLVLGVTAAAVAAHTPPATWWKMTPLMFSVTLFLLVLVLVPGIGSEVNGARRWLRCGPVSFQPSELAKVALPLLLARLLAAKPISTSFPSSRLGTHCRIEDSGDFAPIQCGPGPRNPEHLPFLPVLLVVALLVPLVLLEPDLGTAVFLAAGAAIALWAGGWPLRYFVLAAAVGCPAVVFGLSLKPYQLKRLQGFLAGWSDFQQAPYQLKQSLYALGAGGTFGVGLGEGWQKLSFLPEANTDFVFAVVGEELGLLGTLAMVALWTAFYVFGLRLLRGIPRGSFEGIAAFTLLTQLVLQAMFNAAVVTGLVPPKGIPHPFLSSGGSNLVVSLLSVGLIIGLSRRVSEPERRRRPPADSRA